MTNPPVTLTPSLFAKKKLALSLKPCRPYLCLLGDEFRLELSQLLRLLGQCELCVGGGALLQREGVGATNSVGADLRVREITRNTST